MNLKYLFFAIKRYGLTGIKNFIKDRYKTWNFQKSLEKTMRKTDPEPGITIISCFDYPGSLCKVMRDFAIKLKQAGIPYQTLNIPCNNPIPESELVTFLTPKDEFCLNKYTHAISMRTPIYIPDNRCNTYTIEFWEFEDGFIQNCPEVLKIKNILALSDFNLDVFRKLLPPTKKIQKVLYPFQFTNNVFLPKEVVRKKHGISEDDFVAFFNFDYESSYYRKNPEGILMAFAKSLKYKQNAKLLFKTMRAQKCLQKSNQLHLLAKELGISSQFITIDGFISQEDLVNLTNACDVYISLHRGEGFGLGIAEAMSLGKPVIVTDYSSTKEFCNSNNSILIPYEIVPIKPDQIDVEAYQCVSCWAEPEINAAADALLQLYNDPIYCQKLGANAKQYINDYFSIENFKKSIYDFINTAKQ